MGGGKGIGFCEGIAVGTDCFEVSPWSIRVIIVWDLCRSDYTLYLVAASAITFVMAVSRIRSLLSFFFPFGKAMASANVSFCVLFLTFHRVIRLRRHLCIPRCHTSPQSWIIDIDQRKPLCLSIWVASPTAGLKRSKWRAFRPHLASSSIRDQRSPLTLDAHHPCCSFLNLCFLVASRVKNAF